MTPSYFKKQDQPLWAQDLEWNIPEQPMGRLTLIGGNLSACSGTIKLGEYLSGRFPLEELQILLPDALEGKLPPLPGLRFAPSTPSGSFASFPPLETPTLIYGELSKNSGTAAALGELLEQSAELFSENPPSTPVDKQQSAEPSSEKPLMVITRDAVDLLPGQNLDFFATASNLVLVASLPQLQKLLHALYYPKALYLSMPLAQILEILHKFTLSYPVKILTLHEGQILTAASGQIVGTPLSSTHQSPISLWQGQVAAGFLGLSLYNPGKPLECLASAPFLT